MSTRCLTNGEKFARQCRKFSMGNGGFYGCFKVFQLGGTETAQKGVFLLSRSLLLNHLEPQLNKTKLLLPVMPIDIVAYAFYKFGTTFVETAVYNKKNIIIRWREDINFMFSWQEQYLTRSLRSLVRYCSCHSDIKFISSRHCVISSIYCTLSVI